jgi:hypothetical protein
MGVIRRAHQNRIDLLLHLVKHLAKVLVLFRLGKVLQVLRSTLGIDLAKSHDILTGETLNIGHSLPSYPDRRNIKFLVSFISEGSSTAADQEAGTGGSAFQKVTTV